MGFILQGTKLQMLVILFAQLLLTPPLTAEWNAPTSFQTIAFSQGDVIVDLASYEQASYEKEYNSGMGSNELTSAQHDVFHQYLAEKYHESYDPSIPNELVFTGTKKNKKPNSNWRTPNRYRKISFIPHEDLRSNC